MKRRTNDVAEKMKNARRMLRGIEPTPKGVKHTVEGLKPLEEAEASLERGEIGLSATQFRIQSGRGIPFFEFHVFDARPAALE